MVQEVEYLFLLEVVVVAEPVWLEQVAQEETAGEEGVQERRWKRKVEEHDLHHLAPLGVGAQAGAEIFLLLTPILFLAAKLLLWWVVRRGLQVSVLEVQVKQRRWRERQPRQPGALSSFGSAPLPG